MSEASSAMSATVGVCDSAASSSNPTPRTRSKPRRWTAVEDKFLTQLVAKFGDKRGPQGHWKEIGSRFNGRTAKDCRKRWFHSLDPSLRKGRWCNSEDRILLDAYEQLGPAWHDIALLIPGRKDDQCSKRYREILSPAVRNRLCDWNEEEDRLLMEGVQSFGHSWSAISAQIPGRPPLTCRNRWRVVSKKSRAAVSEEGSGCGKTTSIAASDYARSQSSSDNGTASQSTEFSSGTAMVPPNRASPTNLEIDPHPFSPSCSAVVDEVVGTDAILGDPSHGLDYLMEELYETQHTSAMLPHLLDSVGLPRGSPGPSILPSQGSHESALAEDRAFDLEKSVECQAELEAQTAERRHDTGSTQIAAEDKTCSDRSRSQLNWYLEHSDSLESNHMSLPLTNLSGGFESTRKSLAQEIHHHHHHHHHYHHHHYHHHHSHHYPS